MPWWIRAVVAALMKARFLIWFRMLDSLQPTGRMCGLRLAQPFS